MTTDIAKITENGALPVAVYGSPSEALARIGRWVEAASHAHRLVEPLIDRELCAHGVLVSVYDFAPLPRAAEATNRGRVPAR